MQFASHHTIVEGLRNKLLCNPDPPKFSTVKGARFAQSQAMAELDDIHRMMVRRDLWHDDSPFLRSIGKERYRKIECTLNEWLAEKDKQPIKIFTFKRGKRNFQVWIFNDLSAIVSFYDQKDRDLRIVPWPLQVQAKYTGHRHSFNVVASAGLSSNKEIQLFWKVHKRAKDANSTPAFTDNWRRHQDGQEIRNTFKEALKRDAVRIVEGFETAAPLIIKFDDPNWRSKTDHVVPLFATILNPSQEAKRIGRDFVQTLADYIHMEHPNTFGGFIRVNVMGHAVKEDGSLGKAEVSIDTAQPRHAIKPIEDWASALLNSDLSPIPLGEHLEQQRTLAMSLASTAPNEELSGHRRIEVRGQMKSYMQRFPLT